MPYTTMIGREVKGDVVALVYVNAPANEQPCVVDTTYAKVDHALCDDGGVGGDNK